MDTAGSLVQAYSRGNGYFTVAEYPVLEATRGGSYRTPHGSEHPVSFALDSHLGVPEDEADMLVGPLLILVPEGWELSYFVGSRQAR